MVPHQAGLLDALDESMAAQEREVLLRMVGQRLATQWPIPGGDARARLDQAVEALNQLGGLAELEQGDVISSIRGYSCPFALVHEARHCEEAMYHAMSSIVSYRRLRVLISRLEWLLPQ